MDKYLRWYYGQLKLMEDISLASKEDDEPFYVDTDSIEAEVEKEYAAKYA